jgi:hypothetical protein
LEPRDDLRVAEAQLTRDLVPVCRRQILLVQESLLQLEDLVVGKRCARLPLLLGLLAVVEEVQVIRLPICNTRERQSLAK